MGALCACACAAAARAIYCSAACAADAWAAHREECRRLRRERRDHAKKRLLTAGLHDTRVAFHEPAKFAQRLRAATSGSPADILFKCDMGAGHFSQSDRYAHMREEAWKLAWLVDKLGARARAV